MTKIRRMMSIGLTGCIAMSMLMTGAGAVNSAEAQSVEPEAISVYAGEEMTVNVVHVKPDGTMTQEPLEVSIPEDTTNAEQGEIVIDTALQAEAAQDGMLSARKAPYGTLIGGPTTTTVSKNTSGTQGKVLASALAGTVEYGGLAVYMYDINRTIDKMNVSVWTSSMGQSNCFQMNRVVNTDNECTVIFYDDITYGGDEFLITWGDNISAYGSAVNGSGKVTTELYGIN